MLPEKEIFRHVSRVMAVLEGKESKAMAEQLATAGKLRLFKRAVIPSPEDMSRIDEAIKIQLDLGWDEATHGQSY